MRGGYREVLVVGLPLVASMVSGTVMQFTDRMFLAHHSLEALAASLSGSITNFVFMAFFVGVASYVNVFVAQYTGAGQPGNVGAALWQGLWFSLLAGVALALLSLPGGWIFALAGHAPEIQEMEVAYYRILCWGSGLAVLGMCLSTFYSGRGLTRTVAVVNMIGAALNIPLDYALINGAWGFPALGIRGAGIATVTAWGVTALLFAALVFTRGNEARFGVRSRWRPDRELFARLMRFGLPGGAQLFLDVFGFTVFILLIGRLGTTELAASNLVFSLDHFAFMPMVGLHIAIETLVGQALGAGDPGRAEEVTRSALHLALAWALSLAAVFLLVPEPLVAAFRPADMTPAQYAPVMTMGSLLLVVVAFYTLFDGVALVHFGALKGAGDTGFVMLCQSVCSLLLQVLPVWLLVEVLGWGVYWCWGTLAVSLAVLALAARLRYAGGRWKAMSVISG
ncbi:MATE family efflux transporter [Desulfocurvus sp.]|uniref:MATE family efflux transporter n=1 Tax=Desulfocurvus sp. TaxID=2871698 RepID=UPI0025BB11D6|nr:MATE family efflux transporter [Desulfocurvus sp.]MCK9241227.1 MATE family efflux transporter [Desulfocurvus sp.]